MKYSLFDKSGTRIYHEIHQVAETNSNFPKGLENSIVKPNDLSLFDPKKWQAVEIRSFQYPRQCFHPAPNTLASETLSRPSLP
jgi:hypothetical protein